MLLALLLSCADPPSDPLGPAEDAFDDAALATGVPRELLLAIAKVETNLEPVQGLEEFPGQSPAFGVMGLRGENLERAASLAELDPARVRTDVSANVLAAAALLAYWAAEARVDPDDLGAWAPLVARYSGITHDDALAEYVWYDVYATLAEGVHRNGYHSAPVEAVPDYPAPRTDRARTGDGDTIWTESPNQSSRGGASVDFIIVHACEGSYAGCWSWLTNSASGVSAHYVVKEDGSEVRQLVDEDEKAWHISANYDCGYNADVECERNGTSMNTVSVGIEHGGYSSQSSWDDGLVERSAALACGVAERHGVVRDSYHIVGHGQLQPWNRSDPGGAWPWSDYLAEVDAACGGSSGSSGSSGSDGSSGSSGSGSSGSDGSSGSGSSGSEGASPTDETFIIDSNNAYNDTDAFYVEVSDQWWSSSATSGYWNTGYWVASTEAVSDPASFWFHTDAPRCYTVEAWWTAGSNRPSSVTWMGWDEDDREVGRATVSQQTGGGRFNALGEWTFPAGWNRVLLSRWTTAGAYAIADAVRLTPCS